MPVNAIMLLGADVVFALAVSQKRVGFHSHKSMAGGIIAQSYRNNPVLPPDVMKWILMNDYAGTSVCHPASNLHRITTITYVMA